MRIKVKSEVEVWTPDPSKPPNGAWKAGVVTWGNGHSYIMRWLDGSPESDRIRRQFVRPCPPPVPLPAKLAAGDTVEVFDQNLWKLAEVVGGSAGNRQYDVKITGSSKVLTVDRIELRVQQRLTEDDVWVVVNKDNHEQGSAVPSRPIAGKHVKSKAIGNGIGQFARSAFKLGKRSHCMVEPDIVRDVKRFQGNNNTITNIKRFFAKEEPAARYDDNIEVIDVHPSFNMNKQQQPPPQPQKEMSNSDSDESGQSAASSSGGSSDDDSSSSDGSSSSSSSDGSSSSNGSNRSNGGDRAVSPCQDQSAAIQQPPLSCNKNEQRSSPDRTESRASAGLHHPLSDEKPPLLVVEQQEQYQEEEEEEEEEEEAGAGDGNGDGGVHDLEVEAYVNVMKAFHASGSLDWEKEELLSNLRVHLHISGDEHLQVIWHLNGKTKPPGAPRKRP